MKQLPSRRLAALLLGAAALTVAAGPAYADAAQKVPPPKSVGAGTGGKQTKGTTTPPKSPGTSQNGGKQGTGATGNK
jgi:hypothetical protein